MGLASFAAQPHSFEPIVCPSLQPTGACGAPDGEAMSALLGNPSRWPNRRTVALAGLLVLALAIAGCFDNEPEQRRAFITFLQTRIIDKPGLHIPIMSDKEVADFGPYAGHYRIMN